MTASDDGAGDNAGGDRSGRRAASSDPKSLVASVGKAFAVLSAFTADLAELTIAEIAARSGHDRGTTFRFVHTLEQLGYVAAVPASRRYRLTLKSMELGFSALAARSMPFHARPLLAEVVPEIADAASLGALDGGDVVYLQRVEATSASPSAGRRIGSRTGAYATALGQAALAFLPRDAQIAQLEAAPRVKLSERTLVDLDALLARLDEVRERGFALSDGENAYGLMTVAAPVFGEGDEPLAAVSLTVGCGRVSVDDFVKRAAPHALRIADDLGAAARASLGAIGVGPGA